MLGIAVAYHADVAFPPGHGVSAQSRAPNGTPKLLTVGWGATNRPELGRSLVVVPPPGFGVICRSFSALIVATQVSLRSLGTPLRSYAVATIAIGSGVLLRERK